MTNSCVDGLGGEEMNQAGSQVANVWLTGSLTSESQISGANLYAGTAVHAPDINLSQSVVQTAGSPYGQGTILKELKADEIISGGMWVIGSEGVLKPSPADGMSPLGLCKSTVASGAVCEVITQGLNYVVADNTVTANTQFKQSAGGALNTIEGTVASGARGIVITGASSGANALVYLW